MQITLSCPVPSSFRVQQVVGMFDVPLSEKAEQIISFDMPPLDEKWNIGCIVGPSGSGKTSIARHIWGKNCIQKLDDRSFHPPNSHSSVAVIDTFGNQPFKTITSILIAVGFSSPPSWIKPYAVLSNGEKFRCDLAKALLDVFHEEDSKNSRQKTKNAPVIVFDEYTSVVDRHTAKITSAALSKGIKSGKIPIRFVAVTCHDDILDRLEPDWVLDAATGKVVRRCLRQSNRGQSNIELEVFRCRHDLWNMFKPYHYLTGKLSKICTCYAALWDGKPAAFCALIPQQGFARWYRVSRIVTLPDYQGIGIGTGLLNDLADRYVKQGYRFSITASHPSILSHCKRSPHWKAIGIKKTGSDRSAMRAVVSFERKS